MAYSESLTPETAAQAMGVDPRSLAGQSVVQTYLRLVGPQTWMQAGQAVVAFVFARYLSRAAYEQFPEHPHGHETVVFLPQQRVLSPEVKDPETGETIEAAITLPIAADVLQTPVDVSEVKTFGDLIEAVKRETYKITNGAGLMSGTEDA